MGVEVAIFDWSPDCGQWPVIRNIICAIVLLSSQFELRFRILMCIVILVSIVYQLGLIASTVDDEEDDDGSKRKTSVGMLAGMMGWDIAALELPAKTIWDVFIVGLTKLFGEALWVLHIQLSYAMDEGHGRVGSLIVLPICGLFGIGLFFIYKGRTEWYHATLSRPEELADCGDEEEDEPSAVSKSMVECWIYRKPLMLFTASILMIVVGIAVAIMAINRIGHMMKDPTTALSLFMSLCLALKGAAEMTGSVVTMCCRPQAGELRYGRLFLVFLFMVVSNMMVMLAAARFGMVIACSSHKGYLFQGCSH